MDQKNHQIRTFLLLPETTFSLVLKMKNMSDHFPPNSTMMICQEKSDVNGKHDDGKDEVKMSARVEPTDNAII